MIVYFDCSLAQQSKVREMDSLQNKLEAKEAQLAKILSGSGQVTALKQHYDRVLKDVASERDTLHKERAELVQVGKLLEYTH